MIGERAVDGYVHDRRAIEALRAGVPNRDAVRALGSNQPHLEEKFRHVLDASRAEAAAGKQVPGLLVAGDFGSGKSHLLESFEDMALQEHFVCSRIVISKETPLYDPAKLYRGAIQTARVPGKRGSAVAEIAASLDHESPGYAALVHWASRPDVGLTSRFAATLFLYQRVKDPEIRDRIVSLWSGDPINVAQVRSWLRALGEAATYNLETVPAREMPFQRFSFLSRLIVAAGYAGWVLLFDEVELIGRYSIKQRARSYAELARWAGKLKGVAFPNIATAFAITTDFDTAVLQDRHDLDTIPAKFRASGVDADRALAAQAEQGMRFISRDVLRLKGPDAAMLVRIREQVRDLHARAYRWDVPDLPAGEQLSTTRIRQYVRRWINEWDLKRLYPEYQAETMTDEVATDYSERPDLETPTEESDPGDGAPPA